MRRRAVVIGLLAQPLACGPQPPAAPPRPGDRFRRVHVGTIDVRDRHLDPLEPIFRAALVEALGRIPGVLEVRERAAEQRAADVVLLRGELIDDAGPFLPAATLLARALGGRFELVAPDGEVLQRFAGLQRYAGGPGVAAFSAQGLIDLARLLGVSVAAAVGRWLAAGPAGLPASGPGGGGALTRVS
jgi:hypothetical protein